LTVQIHKCCLLLVLLLAVRAATAGQYKTAKEAVEKGRALVQKQDFDGAIAAFTEALRLDPKSVPAYCGRSRAYWHKDDCEQAIRDADQAVRLEPKSPAAYCERGRAFGQKANVKGPHDLYRTALDDLSESIRLDPKFAEAYIVRGWTHLVEIDIDEAFADFTAAIRIAPTDADMRYQRGLAYQENRRSRYVRDGDFDNAIADFTEAIRLDPKDARFYFSRGESYYEEARDSARRQEAPLDKAPLDRAVADLSEAIQRNPNDAEAWYMRGHCYSMKHDDDRAIADYSEAIRLESRAGRFKAIKYESRARAFARKGNQAKADADFAQAKKLGYKGR
jgi:tetratricopeptide (TPR) repeat protein